MGKKVVLAYSGGLDTTFCALHLSKVKEYEVHALLINTGGFSEQEVQLIEARAQKLGIASFEAHNLEASFYERIIKYLIFGNILKNQTYPLSVSAERIVQAEAIAKYAKSKNADAIAHGSTGAGNDQVRFDMIFQTYLPSIEIITPIRDLKLSREQEIAFLKENHVEMDFDKAQYSINKGLWGTSVGGKETLTSHEYLPEKAFPSQVEKTETAELSLTFKKGELTEVNEQIYKSTVEAIKKVEQLASPYGIGRDIHVGDTIIGIKGRVGFEAAAALIIIKAHQLLEKHTLTKWQAYLKNQMAEFYGTHLHEGQYLDPAMRDLEAMMNSSQKNVSGKVRIALAPYRFTLLGVASPHDLMNASFGSYGEMNNSWTAEDVKGFTKIAANQSTIFHQVNKTFEHD